MYKAKCILIASIICFASGCSTTVFLQIKRAPELNLAGAKTIKIDLFTVSGDLSLDENKNEGGSTFLGALVGLALDAGAKKKAEEKHPGIQQAVWSNLQFAVLKDGYYQLTNGSEYDAVITGLVRYSIEDTGGEKTYKDKEMIYKVYEIERSVKTRIEFTVSDKSGRVLGASEVNGSGYSISKGEDRARAQQNSMPWDKVVIESLANIHEPFIRKISPYFVTESRTFENGESQLIKEGNQAAQKDDWRRAVELWKQGQTTGLPKDRVAAIYNLGIYEEKEGRLRDALNYFMEAKTISGEEKYSADIARTQARIEEAGKLGVIVPAVSTPPASVEKHKPETRSKKASASVPVPAKPAASAVRAETAGFSNTISRPSAHPVPARAYIAPNQMAGRFSVRLMPGEHQFLLEDINKTLIHNTNNLLDMIGSQPGGSVEHIAEIKGNFGASVQCDYGLTDSLVLMADYSYIPVERKGMATIENALGDRITYNIGLQMPFHEFGVGLALAGRVGDYVLMKIGAGLEYMSVYSIYSQEALYQGERIGYMDITFSGQSLGTKLMTGMDIYLGRNIALGVEINYRMSCMYELKDAEDDDIKYSGTGKNMEINISGLVTRGGLVIIF
ncbi:MAG: DUF6340 family protein [candidate division FCPU426 bacterium]